MSPSTRDIPRLTASYMPRSSGETTVRVGYPEAISSVRSVEPPSTRTWSIESVSLSWLQIDSRVCLRYVSPLRLGVTTPMRVISGVGSLTRGVSFLASALRRAGLAMIAAGHASRRRPKGLSAPPNGRVRSLRLRGRRLRLGSEAGRRGRAQLHHPRVERREGRGLRRIGREVRELVRIHLQVVELLLPGLVLDVHVLLVADAAVCGHVHVVLVVLDEEVAPPLRGVAGQEGGAARRVCAGRG